MIKKRIENYCKKYLPFEWVLEGHSLYIKNGETFYNKEDGYTYYPSFSKLENIVKNNIDKQDSIVKDMTKFVDTIMKDYLNINSPIIHLPKGNENLKKLREEYFNKRKDDKD